MFEASLKRELRIEFTEVLDEFKGVLGGFKAVLREFKNDSR